MREMSQKLTVGKVLEAGFGMFRECLRYKLERQGKQLIILDRYFPSARTCSACGFVRDENHYKENTWVCPKCHTAHKREVNSAKNIKAQGRAQYFSMQERCESA